MLLTFVFAINASRVFSEATTPVSSNKKYLLFALSKTNENYEAYSTPSILMEALNGLLNKARTECNGNDLNIPVVGTGLSRSGIPLEYAVELIMIAILNSAKNREITKNINIIIHESQFEKIDLKTIKNKWE